ncbi:MAG: undecaprenyldiphospho-muramoylpentapeptide beta-N-acetylglucosaminyltransferase [Chitinispirillaceae bacterium]
MIQVEKKKIVIAAGGTGGHIFPALAVAMECRRRKHSFSLLWIGTSRSRERELCEKYDIPLEIVDVQGIRRSVSPKNVHAIFAFVNSVRRMNLLFKKQRPDAVIAFGGYVSAPVLAAAKLRKIPFFLQEQNTVPGLVIRMFSKGARMVFLGFPVAEEWSIKGNTMITGTPVRPIEGTYADFEYPQGFDRQKRCILICGGSQGAASMNTCLIQAVKNINDKGWQVVWQTGTTSYKPICKEMGDRPGVFVFDTIDDLYPYYARAKVVIGRSGASTLNEIAFFGLPCVLIPLPWAAENHQWVNAGYVESQGWGYRIAQSEECGKTVEETVMRILGDSELHETMCRKALNYTPASAASDIVDTISDTVG